MQSVCIHTKGFADSVTFVVVVVVVVVIVVVGGGGKMFYLPITISQTELV